MPRTARTTTALIASLSLMVPSFGQVALAQDSAAPQALLPDTPLDGATAATLNAEQARFQPELSAALAAELAAGLTPELLKCADGAAPPCAADVPLVTPSGIAVELAENGTFVLMPAEIQEKAVELTGMTPAHAAEQAGLNAEEAKAAEAAAAVEAEAAKQAEQAAAAEAKAAEEAAKAAEAKAAQDAQAAEQAAADAAKEAEAKAAAEAADAAKAAEAQAAADAQAAEAAAQAAAAQAEAETKAAEQAAEDAQKLAAEEVAKAKAEAAPAAAPATPAADVTAPAVAPVTETPAAEAAAPTVAPAVEAPAVEAPAVETAPATVEAVAEPTTTSPEADAKALAEALAAEGAATAVTPDAPAANAVAVTPEAKAETTVDDLVKALAAEGKAVDATVQPEAVAVETEASKAAAAAAEAPVVAALEAFGAQPGAAAATDAAAPAVEELKITDEGRTSAQDFDTSVAEAARKAAEQLSQPVTAPVVEASKSDGGLSDFEKLAVAGLGALAVGTMLNNNRRVSLNTGDRIVVTRPDGSQEVIKDENVLLFRPGNDVRTETFDDGSTRTIVTREDGSQIITVRDAELRVLKRVKVMADGTEYALIDETEAVTPVQVSLLPDPAPAYIPPAGGWDEAAVREALARETAVNRTFTLNQVRNIPEVRALVAPVEIEAVTFDTGSAAIKPDQARALAMLGTAMQDRIAKNPREMFLIEGHTDTVGQAGMNLALSDRRAESVALALTEYFAIPPENMVVQGYGEQFLKVRQAGDIRANRRAAVRRITDLLQTAANN